MNNTGRLLQAAKDGDVKEVKALLAYGTSKEWIDKVNEIHIMSELYIMSNNTILVLHPRCSNYY